MFDELKKNLIDNNYTIVIQMVNGNIYTSTERGVKPLLMILTENASQLEGASVADKVIGKAAALLMAKGKIKEAYTPIISTPALEVFHNHNISVVFDKEVERIVNRKGDRLCPMESLCIGIDNPDEAFFAIKKKVSEMSNVKKG